MNLPVPGVGNEDGPQWATDLNNCLAIVDQHNHSPGSGVQITPSGLNINSMLTMNNNDLSQIHGLLMTTQNSDLSNINTAYVKSGDWYLNDGAGNHIRITSGGSIVGGTGNIIGLGGGAAVTYVNASTKFVFTDNSSNPAALDSGALIIRQTDAVSPLAVTLQSPNALGANYSLTLFTAIPAQTNIVILDSTGNLGSATYQATADLIGAAMTPTGSNPLVNSITSSVAADHVGSLMTSTGANAIGTVMTSVGANPIVAAVTSSTSANNIGTLMTSTGADSIGQNMTATGSNPLVNSINSSVAANHVLQTSSIGANQSITSFSNTAFTGVFATRGSFTVTNTGQYIVHALGSIQVTGGGTGEVRISTSPANPAVPIDFNLLGNTEAPFSILGILNLSSGDTVAIQGVVTTGSANFDTSGFLQIIRLS